MRGEFIDDEHTRCSYLNANHKVPGRITGRALMSYEWRNRCAIPRHRLLSPVRVWFFERCEIRHDGRHEPREGLVEHIESMLDLLERSALPRSLHMDLCMARCEAESVYALSLSGCLASLRNGLSWASTRMLMRMRSYGRTAGFQIIERRPKRPRLASGKPQFAMSTGVEPTVV